MMTKTCAECSTEFEDHTTGVCQIYCSRLCRGRVGMRNESVASRMLRSAKVRARKLGVEVTITLEDIGPIPDRCPVLGIDMARSSGGATAGSPSLDRINSSRGYVPGNVAVISFRANRVKNDGSAEEHEAIARWMRKVAPEEALSSPSQNTLGDVQDDCAGVPVMAREA